MPRVERVVVTVATLLMIAVLAQRLYTRGGPYFTRPVTIVDRVGPRPYEIEPTLRLLPQIRPLLPRNASVACFQPVKGVQAYQMDNFFAAVGQLPYQKVIPSFAAATDVPLENLAQYVVAIKEPFTHPSYDLVATFPQGRLYKVRR
ncbi:MAG: hypothetical protein ABIP63_00350 [Thermoanaerobaculia bacterium]